MLMQELKSIAIVCVCDNHYAILLAAAIKSVETNHHTEEKLEFFLVEDSISEKNKLRISNSINTGTTTIHWIPASACIPEDASLPVDRSSAPLNVYIRLFVQHFIPKHIKRIIYLDVDMIMLEDVSKLWNTDLGDNIVAAVQDQFIQIVSRWGGVSNYEHFGIAADNMYFNSGLMIIDIEKWVKADVTKKVIACIAEFTHLALYQDQYGLNAVLYKDWYALNPLWNRFAYSEEERPFIIHFTGRKPIYKSYEYSENYRKIFYTYLAMTGWKNFKPIGETSRYFKKLNNLLEKVLKKIGLSTK
jgi:lipopolysaccharide biosynthesis glycosyltransferase